MLAILSIIVLDVLGTRFNAAATYSCYYLRGNYRPVSMLVSIGFFIWAVSWKIKYDRWINYIANATFGVYLIHMYPTVMKYLFSNVFDLSGYIDKNFCIFYLLCGTLTVFLFGVVIDKLREGVFFIIDKIIMISTIRG